jgi:cytidylate kinase
VGFVVAIDGPAGAGKSTVASALARALQWRHLDTGAIYRALTLAAIEWGVPVDDGPRLAALVRRTDLRQGADGRTTLGGRDVSQGIRAEVVTAAVSEVSAHPEVRAALLDVQRQAAEAGDLVCEGRDMGTVVFPNAQLKVYLDADVPTRARRRRGDLSRQGEDIPLPELERRIAERDAKDRARVTAPLLRAPDQIYLDTSGLSVDQVVAKLRQLVEDRLLREQRPG